VGNVRVGVLVQGDVLQARAELVGTMFVEETIKRRAARTAVEPENDGITCRLSGGGNEDVVVVLLRVGEVDISRVHLNEFSILEQGEERRLESVESRTAQEEESARQAEKSFGMKSPSYQVGEAGNTVSRRLSKRAHRNDGQDSHNKVNTSHGG